MKKYKFKFKDGLSEEQEKILYAGFSAFYYDVEEGMNKGLSLVSNKFYGSISKIGEKLTGLNSQRLSVDKIKILQLYLPHCFLWHRTDIGVYEFSMDDKTLDAAIPTLSFKLDQKLKSLVKDKVINKMKLKKEDYTLVIENVK